MTPCTKNTLTTTLAILVAGALAPHAHASGFQLREQSPSAQGSAFAGVTAKGSDISTMFFNPATMTAFDSFQIVVGGTSVAPKAELGSASATRATLPAPLTPFGATAINGPASYPNSAQSAVLPNLYAMWSVSKDFKLGLSVNAPFGLVTEYDANFIGRYHALKSDLKTVDVALNAAYRIHPTLSVGASVIYRKVTAELSNAVDFGQITFLGLAQKGSPAYPNFAPSSAASPFDGKATINGTGTAMGFKAGLVFEPCSTLRAGLSYHSETSIALKGDVSYVYPTVQVPALAGALSAVATAGHLVDGTVNSDVKLPSTASLGVSWDIAPALTLGFEASQTQWSQFKELRMKFGSGQSDSVTNESWRDTWFCSLGANWKLSEALSLRAGLATDQGAAPDSTRTPRIPDGDRTWFSAGLGYAFTKAFTVDLAYTHIAVKDSPVSLTTGASTSPDFFRGNLSGTFKNSIEIVALSARFNF